MADNSGGVRRLTGGPLGNRSRKRWGIAVAAAGLWLALLVVSGSLIASSLLLLMLVMFAGVCTMALRSLGISREHPMVRSLATRPWRDGRDVFQLAMRHLPEVFIVTPKGSLLAPSAIEVRMNPADVDSLAQLIDLVLVNALAVEAYEAEVAARHARILSDRPLEVGVVADPVVPAGRYVLRQRKQSDAQISRGVGAGLRASFTRPDLDAARTKMTGQATVAEPSHPLLRLVTGKSVTQTRTSGARAGRGRAAELTLPDEPTISRVHGKFTCAGSVWQVTSLGRNGMVVNGTLLIGEQPIHDGDLIRWGRQADAPISRVEIL